MTKKIIPLFLFLLIATPAYAESATVNISNSVNTSGTNSTSSTKSETHIKVETNGKVTEYNSDKPGNVEVRSVNGESSIKVNGETVSGNPSTEPSTDISPTATKSPTPKPEKSQDEEKQNAIEEFIETLDNAIEKLLSVFH